MDYTLYSSMIDFGRTIHSDSLDRRVAIENVYIGERKAGLVGGLFNI